MALIALKNSYTDRKSLEIAMITKWMICINKLSEYTGIMLEPTFIIDEVLPGVDAAEVEKQASETIEEILTYLKIRDPSITIGTARYFDGECSLATVSLNFYMLNFNLL